MVAVLLDDVLLNVPRLINRGAAIVEYQDGQLLERVVLGGLRGALPWNLSLELEGDAFLEERDAVLARVGRGRGAYERQHIELLSAVKCMICTGQCLIQAFRGLRNSDMGIKIGLVVSSEGNTVAVGGS